MHRPLNVVLLLSLLLWSLRLAAPAAPAPGAKPAPRPSKTPAKAVPRVDPQIVGEWHMRVLRKASSMTWKIDATGSYTLKVVGPRPVNEIGTIVAHDGRWSATAVSGRKDAGTYKLASADRLEMTGGLGEGTWQRVKVGQISHLPHLPLPHRTPPLPSPSPSAEPSPSPTAAPDTAGVAIKDFYHNAKGPLKPGDSLVVTLIGTPNGKASFFIQGAVEDVPMREISAGTYSADYKFAPGARLRDARVFGTLQVGTARAPLATAASLVTVEPPRPHIEQPEPAPGSVSSLSTPKIAGFFETVGGALDLKTVVIRVNGADVTSKAYVTQKFFTYTPTASLPSGRVRVEVEGKVGVGEPLKDGWEFDVQGGSAIASATHGSQSAYQKGETVNVTMVGTRGGQASFDIGSYRMGLPMRETATPGTYVGSYTVASEDRVDGAPIIVRLQVTGFPTASFQAPIPVTLGRGPIPSGDVPLTVTSPRPNATVGQDYEVKGRTAPGASVTVEVTGHVPVAGDVHWPLAQVKAGADGSFKADVHLPIPVPVGYTITVAAIDTSGRAARPVNIQVSGK